MVSIFVGGDIINQYSHNMFIGDELAAIIRSADYSIANLEGGIAENSSFQKMKQTCETPHLLKQAGFDMMLLSNNHICDYGRSGLNYTVKYLDEENLEYIGAGISYNKATEPVVKKIDNLKFGFINVCEAQHGYYEENSTAEFGYAWLGDAFLPERIKTLKSQVDVLLVFVHAGLEHFILPLRHYRDLYKRFCDLGADYVIGTHPHIAQGYEFYNNSCIFYSLGNLFFPRSPEADRNDRENCSFSLLLSFNHGQRDFRIINHSIKNAIVEVENDSHYIVDIERLNNDLKEDRYSELLKLQNKKAFNSLLLKLYNEAILGYGSNKAYEKMKFLLKQLFRTREQKACEQSRRLFLLKHLLENETYKYLAIETIKEMNNG